MSGHIQIAVLKEGSYNGNHWSNRTLTIDLPTETVTISRHDHPNDLYHHSMRVLGIQKWPHVSTAHTGHDHDSPEAKMTLHLIGMKVPTQKFGSEDARSTTSTGTGTTTPGEHLSPSNNTNDPAGSGVDGSWMIRCTSQESYNQAVKLLEEIVETRMKHGDRHTAHHGKDAGTLKKFPLPENVTAPAVLTTSRHAPIM